jgi:hypothetical protein
MKPMRSRVLSIVFLFFLSYILILPCSIPRAKSEPNTITVPDDFSTIQEAINNANEYDTIFVRNGTYYENVVVNKSIYLRGEDARTTVVDGSKGFSVLNILGGYVNVSGLTLRNSGSASGGIYVTSAQANIYENNIVNNGGGVDFLEGGHSRLARALLEDFSILYGCRQLKFFCSAHSITENLPVFEVEYYYHNVSQVCAAVTV